MNKLYLVKREVYAKDIKAAMTNKGNIYSIELAEEKDQPIAPKKLGFTSNGRKTKI